MESIDKQILASIKKCGRGKVFFPDRFTRYGNPTRVQKAMEQLVASGDIIRVARGIYCYPNIDKVFGLGVLYPGTEDIAKAIAKRDSAKMVPTGEWAQYQLGLTQQIPMNVVYLTDGSARTINLIKGGTIRFKHVAPKNFAFSNGVALLIMQALSSMGQKNVTDDHIKKIKEHLQKEGRDAIMKDMRLMPNWIKEIVLKSYE